MRWHMIRSRPTRGARGIAALAVTLFAVATHAPSAAYGGAAQAEWTFPVPAGAEVLEYPAVPLAERRGRTIRLVEDLLIKERGDDRHYLFDRRPPQVAVDAEGNIYVGEPMPRTGRVQVFDNQGEFVRQVGRSGQGPGEYLQPIAPTVAGSTLFIFDPGQSRISVWNLDGGHVDDVRIEALRSFRPAAGRADGTVVGRTRLNVPGEWDSGFGVAIRIDAGATQLTEYARMPWPVRIVDPGFGEISRSEPNAFYAGATYPTIAAGADGPVYLSTLDEYQVLAYEPDGTPRWALRVPWEGEALAEVEIEWLMDFHNQRFPQARRHEIDWPERQFVLGDIKVDGHGRLYVFPYVPRGSAQRERPVDVYSSAGELLFAGTISGAFADLAWQAAPAYGPMLNHVWQAAYGDFIYGVRRDRRTEEWQVVRHRLTWP